MIKSPKCPLCKKSMVIPTWKQCTLCDKKDKKPKDKGKCKCGKRLVKYKINYCSPKCRPSTYKKVKVDKRIRFNSSLITK